MSWRQCVLCVECGDEVDLGEQGQMPPGPCEEGGGACGLVIARIWDAPAEEVPQGIGGTDLWGAPGATTPGGEAAQGQPLGGLFAAQPAGRRRRG